MTSWVVKRTDNVRGGSLARLLLCIVMTFALGGWMAMAENMPRLSFPENPEGVLTAVEASEDETEPETEGLAGEAITANAVAALCREVSQMLAYGVGPEIEGRSPNAKELLDYGEGHCGEFAYLFCRRLAGQGIRATVYAISSFYKDYSTMDHSIVEVQTADGKCVFDPTYGGYYRADMETLLSCDDVMAYAVGFEDVQNNYVTQRFFSEARTVSAHPFIEDEYDLDLLTWIDNSVRANLPSRSDKITEDASLAQNVIDVSFSEPQEFYRLKLRFREQLPEDVALSCLCGVGGENWSVDDARLTQRQYALEYLLDAPVTVDQIQLSISTGLDKTPKLMGIYVYQ